MMVANHFSHVIGVYNLEGCVPQGFLARLKIVNWNVSVCRAPHLAARLVASWRNSRARD
jgi:hypothetical protein